MTHFCQTAMTKSQGQNKNKLFSNLRVYGCGQEWNFTAFSMLGKGKQNFALQDTDISISGDDVESISTSDATSPTPVNYIFAMDASKIRCPTHVSIATPYTVPDRRSSIPKISARSSFSSGDACLDGSSLTSAEAYCGLIFTAVCILDVVAPPISNGSLHPAFDIS